MSSAELEKLTERQTKLKIMFVKGAHKSFSPKGMSEYIYSMCTSHKNLHFQKDPYDKTVYSEEMPPFCMKTHFLDVGHTVVWIICSQPTFKTTHMHILFVFPIILQFIPLRFLT